MLTEMRDTVGLVLIGDGHRPRRRRPRRTTRGDRQDRRGSRDGPDPRFTGNDYTKDLAAGDLWACVGWSGDAVQLQADNPNIEFRMPEEGGMLWSDNMLIPQSADDAYGAETFMNYVYDPRSRPQIAAYVNYVCPVKGVQGDPRTKTDPELANNQLIFPTEATLKQLHAYPSLGAAPRRADRRDAEGHRGVSTAGAAAAPKAGGGWLTLRRRRA